MSTIHGDDKDIWDTKVNQVPLQVQEHEMLLDCQVMNMTRADIILGREWLYGLGPSLKRSYEHDSMSFNANGTHGTIGNVITMFTTHHIKHRSIGR